MLTIENITKVWKQDVAGWRIGKIETTNGAYLFQLYKLNRRERMQVNLERNGINGEYELWHWKPAVVGMRSTNDSRGVEPSAVQATAHWAPSPIAKVSSPAPT